MILCLIAVTTRDGVEETLQRELGLLLRGKGIAEVRITPDVSLIDGLGLDSFQFVDLTLAIEQSFQIPRFPMQLWIDGEATKREDRFTVGSLVDCILKWIPPVR